MDEAAVVSHFGIFSWGVHFASPPFSAYKTLLVLPQPVLLTTSTVQATAGHQSHHYSCNCARATSGGAKQPASGWTLVFKTDFTSRFPLVMISGVYQFQGGIIITVIRVQHNEGSRHTNWCAIMLGHESQWATGQVTTLWATLGFTIIFGSSFVATEPVDLLC